MNSTTKRRVLSPHLTIYKPQISSILSMMHRLTGILLFIGFLVLLWWIVSLLSFPNPHDTILWHFFSTNYGLAALFMWSFCLFFHLYNGFRYLFWGKGKGFDIGVMTMTGYAVLLMSLCTTILVWYVAKFY